MMTGKCNLLKSLTSETGTYFTFSQTGQDLTQQFGQSDTYRVVPSRFAALDLNLIAGGGSAVMNGKEIGEIFQNYFENACTFLRYRMGEGFLPHHTNTLLWKTLEKYGLINLKDINTANPTEDNPDGEAISYKTCDELKYIGDINIHSYEKIKDGTGYNEIYVLVPDQACSTEYRFVELPDAEAYPYIRENICGWDGVSTRDLSWKARCDVSIDGTKSYSIGSGAVPYDCMGGAATEERDPYPFVTHTVRATEDPFCFNCIVIFYNIVSKSKSVDDEDYVLYSNVPMGIYFTGKPLESGKMSNFVTKWVQNPEIYNQGTSYGLRICSRYLCSPLDVNIIETIETDADVLPEYTSVMEAFARSAIEVQDILSKDNDTYRLVKTHLDMFKNNQVNVPYTKKVGSYYYWFVNGKNTGRRIDTDLIPRIEELQNEINSLSIKVDQAVQVKFMQIGTDMDDIRAAWDNTPWLNLD